MTINAFPGRFECPALFGPALVASSAEGSIQLDLTPFTGHALFRLLAEAGGGSVVVSAKLRHADTLGGTYSDVPDGAFPIVAANTAQDASLELNIDGLKPFVRVAFTVTGGTGTGDACVFMAAQKKYNH